MASVTINYDQVSSLAREKYLPVLVDQIYKANVLLQKLRPRIKTDFTGRFITVPLVTKAENFEAYSGWDKANMNEQNPFEAANFYARSYRTSVSISADAELQVTGDEAVMNLVSARMENASDTFSDGLGTEIYNAATNPKGITGLQYAIPETIVSVAQTYGNISCGGQARTTDPNGFWQPYADNTAYTAGSTGGTFMQVLENPVQKAWNNIVSQSGKKPDIIVSNYGAWGDYHNSLAKMERFVRPQQKTDLAESGFENLMYRTAAWVADPKAPRTSGGVEKVYLLHTPHILWAAHPQRHFKQTDFMSLEVVGQDGKVAFIYLRSELCFKSRRSQGVIGNVTVPSSIL